MLSGVQWLDASLIGLLGLLIGSFLNVVVYRLPKMLEQGWAAECAELSGKELATAEPFNLIVPRSRCPHCAHQIRWFENIPVLSYIALRGACSNCSKPISLRYPAVELVTGTLFYISASLYGVTWLALAWATFSALLIALLLIDFDTQLLLDDLNYPLLWLGLIIAALGWNIGLKSAVWGAVFGYMSLWSVYQLHHFLTGKEGLGYGDFKLLAALGAWFGAEHLLAIVLMSSVVGSIFGGLSLFMGRLRHKDIPFAFGPFLAGAGLLMFVIGPSRLAHWIPFIFPFTPSAG
jgi:leader peptidase (prepilin peptidase)/N-methyltransferase